MLTHRNSISRHLKKHQMKKIYTCPLPSCKATYNRHDNLTTHIKTKHEENVEELLAKIVTPSVVDSSDISHISHEVLPAAVENSDPPDLFEMGE